MTHRTLPIPEFDKNLVELWMDDNIAKYVFGAGTTVDVQLLAAECAVHFERSALIVQADHWIHDIAQLVGRGYEANVELEAELT